MKVETRTAPAEWASYLINGDASSLSTEEIAQVDNWTRQTGWGSPVSCEPAGFIRYHDARWTGALPADCETYTFLRAE